MVDSLHIGLLQLDVFWRDPAANIDLLAELLDTLTEVPDLLVLPEMWTTGFTMSPQSDALSMDDEHFDHLHQLASDYGTSIIGSHAIRQENNYYNRVILTTPDGNSSVYDKQFLFSPSGEDQAYTAGAECQIFHVSGWKVKAQVCYDLRFPEGVRDSSQPDLIIYMANWPSTRVYHWDQLLIARAIENQCYVIGTNRTGADANKWKYTGHSAVVDYTGKVLTPLAVEDLLLESNIHKSEGEKYRSALPFYKDKKLS